MVCSRETRTEPVVEQAPSVPAIQMTYKTSYEDPSSPISSVRRPNPVVPSTESQDLKVSKNLSTEFENNSSTHPDPTIFSSPSHHASDHDDSMITDDETSADGNNENSSTQDTFDSEFDPFVFIRGLPPIPQHYRFRPSTLPCKTRQNPRCTLVLDLDETLLHSTITPIPKPDLVIPVGCNGQEFQVYVKKRPHLQEFLDEVSSMFEVIVFTASQRVYAEKLLNILDPDRKWIKYRQYRDSCVEVEGNFLKDLTVLGRDLATTIIVDNSIHAFAYQLDNGVPILSWFDDETDTHLLGLLPLLRQLATAEDVRPILREKFHLSEKAAQVTV